MPDIQQNGQVRPAIGYETNSASPYILAEKVHLRTLKEAYYQWVARLTILFCILSLAFFASASLVLFRMAPEVQVEPFLIIKQDDSSTMVRYEVISPNMASNKQLMETFIRQYIMMRNNILNDETEMYSRWYAGGLVNYLSAPNVYIDFKKNVVTPKLNEYLKDGLVRDTEIISVGKVGGEKSPVWKVDFRTYDLEKDQTVGETQYVLKTRYWTASLVALFVPQRLFMGRRLLNPLGFTVTRYSQTEVEIL